MNHYSGSVPDTDRATDWRDHGVCRKTGPTGKPLYDPDFWFPNGTTGPALLQTEDAKQVCYRCPVIDECLRYALDTGQEFGVFGGLSEGERRSLKRRAARKAASKPAAPTAPDALVFSRTGSLADQCRELYERYTQLRDGHLVWIAERTQVKIEHRERTYGRICFRAGHGRWPDGPVHRTCEVDRCVAPACLTDKVIRAARKRAAERKAEAVTAVAS